MRSICLLVIASLAIGINAAGETDKLVGAKHAEIAEFPYQVSLRMNGRHFCGGALISKKHVLTAAHCIYAVKKSFMQSTLAAVVGSNSLTSGGESYRAKEMSHHPEYVDKRLPDWMYDIGVITLSKEVTVSDRVAIVKLPTKEPEVGTEAIASGWGTMVNPTSPLSQSLQKLTLKIISFVTCQNQMPIFAKVHPSQICTFVKKGAGACSGDSGGPLVQDGIIIGVVSGGIPCAIGYPDIFTKVFTYLTYINEIVEK